MSDVETDHVLSNVTLTQAGDTNTATQTAGHGVQVSQHTTQVGDNNTSTDVAFTDSGAIVQDVTQTGDTNAASVAPSRPAETQLRPSRRPAWTTRPPRCRPRDDGIRLQPAG